MPVKQACRPPTKSSRVSFRWSPRNNVPACINTVFYLQQELHSGKNKLRDIPTFVVGWIRVHGCMTLLPFGNRREKTSFVTNLFCQSPRGPENVAFRKEGKVFSVTMESWDGHQGYIQSLFFCRSLGPP